MHPVFIKKLDGTLSFGGDQAWLAHNRLLSESQAHTLSQYGCGLIGLGDLILTLTQSGQLPPTRLTKPFLNKEHILEQRDYCTYLIRLYRLYLPIFSHLGVQGPLLAHAFNHYAQQAHSPLHAKWAVPKKQILPTFQKMLSKQIPVLFSIGPNYPNLLGTHGVPLYEKKGEPGSPSEVVRAHYMTVIGIDHSSCHAPLLQLSTWGQERFLAYQDYLAYLEQHSWTFLTNLLLITQRNAPGFLCSPCTPVEPSLNKRNPIDYV